MTNLDNVFEIFPGTTLTTGRPGFSFGATEEHANASFLPQSAFIELFYRGEFTSCCDVAFTYVRPTAYTMDALGFHLPPADVIRTYVHRSRSNYLVRGLDWWAYIGVSDSHIGASFGAQSINHASSLARNFRAGLETEVPNRAVTDFEIWSGDDYPSTRSFPDTRWSTIAHNYPLRTRRGLDDLSNLKPANLQNNGRVVLFHGPPGTGKTWAIRSLLTTWKEWTQPAVVIDPEQLLHKTSYFMSMLTFANDEHTRLIVIEDADEIAEKDGTRGSHISRLLNATDGLVGAGVNLLIVLSTNAPPSSLDAALLRPGRCLATIEFSPFSAGEASERLGRSVSGPTTLAELYQEMGTVSKVNTSSEDAGFGTYL